MNVYKSEKMKEQIHRTYDLLIKAWDTPVDQVDVKGTYGITHVNVFGKKDAKPLVLFHGVGDDSALMWIYNAKALAEHFHVYAVDTIGGPGKSIPGEKYNKDFDDIQWIDEILDYFHLDRIYIAGVSHGGYLTQYYMLKRPERIIKAISLASGVAKSSGKGSSMKTMMKIFFPEAFFPTKKNVVKLLNKLSGNHGNVFTENPLVLEHYSCLLKGFNNMSMGFHKVDGFSDDEISKIREHCKYLIGDDDPFAKLGGKERTLEYKMNVTFFPGVGHGINHEISCEINQFIIDYFTK